MRKKHHCPNCHSPAFSTWDKLTIGPATYRRCPFCGEKISVPISSYIAFLPFYLAIYSLIYFGYTWKWVGCVMLSIAFMTFVMWKFIPLTVKKKWLSG